MELNTNQNEQWKLLVLLLNELRVQKNISINQVAEITGIRPEHVSRFFSCKFEPKFGNFLKISKAIQVNFFFEDIESKKTLKLTLKPHLLKTAVLRLCF